ncbi:MAG: MarR family transcriptional regulator [Planctomycetes bacterium]|nr:MarR family transcriptional regulator [Planctomycetota bacterium]
MSATLNKADVGGTTTVLPGSLEARIVHALRRILRQVELGSKELEASHGVTAPQLLSLLVICEQGSTTQAELSRHILLSASTLVGVLDRLEGKGLILRQRDTADRRRIHLVPTEQGRQVAATAPLPMHERLVRGLPTLDPVRRGSLAEHLEELVDLLGAGAVDDAGVLASGPIPQPPPVQP